MSVLLVLVAVSKLISYTRLVSDCAESKREGDFKMNLCDIIREQKNVVIAL